MRAYRIVLIVALQAAAFACASAQSTISTNTSQKYVWSSGAGWINCRTDSTNGAAIGEFVCSGYIYSSAAGWIHLGNGYPSNGVHYATNSSSDYGVNHDGQGHLTGFAWSPSFGWISFQWTNKESASAPKVDLKTGVCSGYAWGGSLGWISLTNVSAYLKTLSITGGADVAANGIPDAWEISMTGSTGLLSKTGNYDGDKFTDYEEYLAGTNPTNAEDQLELVEMEAAGITLDLSWASSPSRIYKLEARTNLLNGTWDDAGFGWLTSSTDTISTLSLSTEGTNNKYYRVKAALPLSGQ